MSNTTATAPSLDKSIGYMLRRAQLSTYDEFSAAMQPFDIRPSQFAVLVSIRANPGITQSEICAALRIRKPNLVALLDELERRSLTERRKVEGDRRSFALHLTKAGQPFVKQIEALHKAMEKTLVKRLGIRRSRELLVSLRDFSNR